MNLQFVSKLLLASSVAACCATGAQAQIVDGEITANVASLQGPDWGSGSLGQPVTLDVAYDFSQQSTSLNNNIFTLSWPIISASIVGGPFGSGTNLEPDGAGSGTVAEGANLITGAQTQTFLTSIQAPSSGFTGDVYGISFASDGTVTTLDVMRNAFLAGNPDAANSGEVVLSNVQLTTTTVSAPEIDSTSTLSAMSLLIGALAVMRGKRFAKVTA